MKITDVKVKLAHGDEKLLAFASVTFDNCFVVRDIKVIQGASGLFVAMPSRKITDRCVACGAKNLLQSRFCGHCGTRLPERRGTTDTRGRSKFHADIAHPINSRYRKELQDAILGCFQTEVERSRQPGYVPPNLDEVDAGPEEEHEMAADASVSPPAQQATSMEKPSAQPASESNFARPTPRPAKGDGTGMGIFA